MNLLVCECGEDLADVMRSTSADWVFMRRAWLFTMGVGRRLHVRILHSDNIGVTVMK